MTQSNLLLLLTFFCISIIGNAQVNKESVKGNLRLLHDEEGDSSPLTEDEIEQLSANHEMGPGWPLPDEGSLNRTQKMLDDIAQNGDRASFPHIIQPISFINFYQADGTGKVSYDSIQKQVDQLNSAFSGNEARKGGFGPATDSNIRFKLAGVRYVQNDDYFNLCTLPSTISVVRPRYMMDGSIHLNVYVCWNANSLGLAWLPYDSWFRQVTGESHYALGAIVHWELLPGNHFKGGLWSKGNILTHELGHSYGLRHPYQGDCIGDESNSDQIADTPRMTGNPLVSCAAVKGRDSCQSLAGNDDMSNYMVATGDTCRNHFTPGQVSYMQSVISTYKPTLMQQLLPSCVAAVDSTDYSPDLQPCLKGSVKETSTGAKVCKTDPDNADVWAWACCPTNYDWDVDLCRQGTPDFSLPVKAVEMPQLKNITPTIVTKSPVTKNPTKQPTTKSPVTKNPTKQPTTKHPTKSPVAGAKGSTMSPVTSSPTKKPTTRRWQRRHSAKRG